MWLIFKVTIIIKSDILKQKPYMMDGEYILTVQYMHTHTHTHTHTHSVLTLSKPLFSNTNIAGTGLTLCDG
jgi:hypothetical protein